MKPIKITQSLREELLKKFSDYVNDTRFSDTKIKFSADINDAIPKDTLKPIVLCTPLARLKMYQLVNGTDSEIGWHGTVTKVDNVYTIEDIILYPQFVTGSTVTTDEEGYANFIMGLDDETFNKLRMQGHSHVNMGVTPSGVDDTYYEKVLQNLTDGDHYIFMIMNKKAELNIWVYDFSQNIIFEKEDVKFNVSLGDETLGEWAHKQKEANIQQRVYGQQTVASNIHVIDNRIYNWQERQEALAAQTINIQLNEFGVAYYLDDKGVKRYGTRGQR